MATIIATPGAADANSYLTLEEANTYFDERLPLPTPWENAEYPEAALIMATRVLNMMLQPMKQFFPAKNGVGAYYITRRQWTGLPATAIQRLAWPRIGMYDMNGNAIAENVVPQALKDATAELAGQLIMSDSTLDNDVSVQGITSIKAGSVSLTFKDMIDQHIIPSAVLSLLPASWITDEIITPAQRAVFEVVL